MMERSCSCCNHHHHHHHRHRNPMYDDGTGDAQQPSPAWPLVLLCLVFTLLMGPLVLEAPEEVFSISQVGAFFMLLPFLSLVAFYFFNTNPSSPSASEGASTHNSYSYTYNGHAQPPSPPSEEPLHGWGLFLMFILAIILVPLTRS